MKKVVRFNVLRFIVLQPCTSNREPRTWNLLSWVTVA